MSVLNKGFMVTLKSPQTLNFPPGLLTITTGVVQSDWGTLSITPCLSSAKTSLIAATLPNISGVANSNIKKTYVLCMCNKKSRTNTYLVLS